MLPKVTTTVTTEITLTPALRKRALAELKLFAELQTQQKVLTQAMRKGKDIIQRLFEGAGEFDVLVQGVVLDGFKMKYVTGTRTILDKGKLIDLGVTVEMLEEATIEKPNAPYLKISVPGEKDGEE